MLGYFLHLDHIIKIDVDDFYFKPMQNPHFAKYTSKHFKILEIKSLNDEIKKELDGYIHLRFYKQEVDYLWSEEQIKDSLSKENGFIRLYYDSGNLKERYFVKDGQIVKGTYRFYDDN